MQLIMVYLDYLIIYIAGFYLTTTNQCNETTKAKTFKSLNYELIPEFSYNAIILHLVVEAKSPFPPKIT